MFNTTDKLMVFFKWFHDRLLKIEQNHANLVHLHQAAIEEAAKLQREALAEAAKARAAANKIAAFFE
jgi:hypothetical protein